MWIVCRQTIHMKFHALFSLKDKKKKYFRMLSEANVTVLKG